MRGSNSMMEEREGDGIKAVNDIEEKEQKSSSTKVTLTKDGTFKIN